MLRPYLLAGAVAPCLLLAVPAVAQTRAPTPTGSDQTSTGVAIGGDDIVVTATTPRSTASVLTSIDILNGDVAQRQNVSDAWELFARLPGVTLTDFTIRYGPMRQAASRPMP